MIAAFDVHYPEDGGALAAAVVFENFSDRSPCSIYRKRIASVEDYIPGSFYRRELPCILSLLAEIRETIHTVIIDGYVRIGSRPGLGEHLRNSVDFNLQVIGVAKSRFEGSRAEEVLRGNSRRPLYVTSLGFDAKQAADLVLSMHGKNRIPTLLKAVDKMSRAGAG
ncbi:MAG: endonuclease V [Gammaproteobacteria bacterium]